jgi:hypothetical protein
MIVNPLTPAVARFAAATQDLSESDLERKWVWQDYDEGVRFAFFRTYEELRQLAASLEVARASLGAPPGAAQRALAGYHAAYRDLQAVLIGVSAEDALRPPVEGQWPVQKILLHVAEAERAFFAITSYTLARLRDDPSRPLEMPDETWEAFWRGDSFAQVSQHGSYAQVLAYYDQLHARVLEGLAGITAPELSAPSVFWEDTPMPVQFRLHRFDSHLRQHTIQVEKTLDQLDLSPTEAKRLLRLIYAALAEVESSWIGIEPVDLASCQALAASLDARSEEIASLM